MAIGTIGAIALGVAGASAAGSAIQGRKARKSQRRANEAQRKINRLKNFQAKRQFLKGFRQAQAANLVTGVAAGIGLESSRVQAQKASTTSQARGAVAEFNLMDRLGGEQTAHLNRAARYQFQSGLFGQVSSFALSFASFGGSGSTAGSAASGAGGAGAGAGAGTITTGIRP